LHFHITTVHSKLIWSNTTLLHVLIGYVPTLPLDWPIRQVMGPFIIFLLVASLCDYGPLSIQKGNGVIHNSKVFNLWYSKYCIILLKK